jgi:hypothetical protein
MAKEITVNNETKSIDLVIQKRGDISLEISRSVSTSGVLDLLAGNNISVSNSSGNVTVSVTSNISTPGNITANVITANSFVGPLTGNVNGNVSGNVNGNVSGNLTGNVLGNVQGNLSGNVLGNLTGNVLGNVSGNVTGNVTGNVNGNVSGNLSGNVTGNVLGNLSGNVTGNLNGNVTGNVLGNLSGNVTGNVNGTLTGNVIGNVQGNVSGNLTGNVLGNVSGNVTGNVNGNVTGNLTGSITGNLVMPGNITANLITANVFYGNLQGNIIGNLIVPGANTQVLFNTDGNADASANLTFNKATGLLNVIGNANIGKAAINSHITPTGNAVDLGNSTNRFRDLYLQGNTIYLGNYTIGTTNDGIVMSGNIAGDGSHLTNINGANVTGQVGNASVAGTVYTNAQPNITSLGTLTGLNVSGNATITGNLTVSGNTIYANVETLNVKDPIIEQGGDPNGSPLTTNDGKDRGQILHYYSGAPIDAFMGWDNSNAEFAFGSNVSVTNEVATFNQFGNVRARHVYANIDGANVIGDVSGANHANVADVANSVNAANVIGTVANANYSAFAGNAFNVSGSNVTGQVGNALIAGTVYTNAQPNITSVGNLSSLNVVGNVSASYFIGNGSQLTGLPEQYSNANVANYLPTYTGNLKSGNANLGNLTISNYFSGDGSLLTNLNIANATVANANYAAYAGNAFSVTGSNVSGDVAGANHANVADVANSVAVGNVVGIGNIATINLNGNGSQALLGNGAFGDITSVANANYANFAGTAYSVSGSNVSGAVANANYAAYAGNAFSVSGSNVSGAVANANYAAYAGNAFSVTGSNVVGDVAGANHANVANLANSVSGSNVTGQVGNALIAGTVYTNAQPNITSVGTLTNLAISGNLTTVDSVTYDTTAGITPGVAQTAWDDGEGTLALGLKGGNVVLNIGEQEVKRVYNAEANTLVKGEVVYVFGAQGNRISVKRALANTDANSAGTIGIVQESIASGSEGFIINSGTLYKFNTSAYTPGQPIYLSPTTPGAFTTTKPLAPNHLVTLGWIERVHATVGSIYVKINNGYELDELHNVSIANAANGQTLVYSNGIFINGNAQYSNTSGTVLTNSQPNITSVGTLSGLSVVGNLNITGNINATGNINYSNVSDLVVGDPLIFIGANNTGNLVDLGFVASYNDGANEHAGIARDASDGIWKLFDKVLAEPTTTIDFANATYAQFKAGNIIGANLTVNNANLGNLAVANFLSGNGSLLTSITGGNVTGQVGNALVAGTVYSNSQPNITSVGSLVDLTVTGNILGANANLGNLVTANFLSGNGSLLRSITGANVTGQVANALVSGTVYTNAQPNITSVGNLTSANVTGNLVAGNISGTNLISAGDFSSGGTILILGNSQLAYDNDRSFSAGSITGTTSPTANIPKLQVKQDWNNASVTYTSIQQSILDTGSGANSILLDLRSGNSNANIATQFAVNKVGNVYANVYHGNGSQLTNVIATSATTAGTVTTNAQPNITSVGTLANLNVAGFGIFGQRIESPRFDLNGFANTRFIGNIIPNSASTGTIGNSNVYWSGGFFTDLTVTNNIIGNISGSAGSANSVTGSNVTGQVGNALVSGTVYTNAQPNITSVGNLSSLNVTGNVTASYFIGNGSQLTGLPESYSNANVASYLPTYTGNLLSGNANLGNLVVANFFSGNGSLLTSITGSNVTGTVANATYATSAGSATTSGTVTDAAQPNITSVGNLSSLTVTGNVTANYFIGNGSQLTGIVATNANTAKTILATVYNAEANTLTTGTVVYFTDYDGTDYGVKRALANSYTTSQTVFGVVDANIASGAQGNIVIKGRLNGVNTFGFTPGDICTLSSTTAGQIDVGGTGDIRIGYVSEVGIIGGGEIYVDIDQPKLLSTLFDVTITSPANGQAIIRSGNLWINGNVEYSNIANTAYSVAVGNVVGIGNIATINLNGNGSQVLAGNGVFVAQTGGGGTPGGANTELQFNNNGAFGGISTVTWNGANLSLGNIANIKITGGTNAQVLQTDGTGNLSWTNQSGGGGGGSTGFEQTFLMMGA